MTPYYEHRGITIYHGDCREVVLALGRFGLLLTDPPYGIGAGRMNLGKWQTSRLPKGDWDTRPADKGVLDMLRGAADRAVIWGGNYFELPPSRNFFVWDKGAGFRGRDFAECEQAWCSWDGNAKVYTRDPLAEGDYRGKEHHTEKPVALFKWCIGQAGVLTKRILDPFAGSGTTGIAAKAYGIQAVLVEIEERYCEIAAKRLQQEVLPLEQPA